MALHHKSKNSFHTRVHHTGKPNSFAWQLIRLILLTGFFSISVLAINFTQLLTLPLAKLNPELFFLFRMYTRRCFGVVLTTINAIFSPSRTTICGDDSTIDLFWINRRTGLLESSLGDRAVLIANHQLYSDWIFLWWCLYTSQLHGAIVIMLKDSLKHIPFLGWGMQFFKFIFMSRKWENDEPMLKQRFQEINKNRSWPCWLVVFPEGTVMSPTTCAVSEKWQKNNHLTPFNTVLHPRSRGLRFLLSQVNESVAYIYDVTVVYSGVNIGKYGEQIYTLRSSFLEGRPPNKVSMFWRRFPIREIPIDDQDKFDNWLESIWAEKNRLLNFHYQYGRFPNQSDSPNYSPPSISATEAEKKYQCNQNHQQQQPCWACSTGTEVPEPVDLAERKPIIPNKETPAAGFIPRTTFVLHTHAKLGSWTEVFSIFAPLGIALLMIRMSFVLYSMWIRSSS